MYSEIYEKTGREIIREIGLRFSNYRKRIGFTQKEIAEKSGLSVFTLSSFANWSSS